jgi:centrosomal protein CEP41
MGGDGAESMYSVNTVQTGVSAVTYNTEQLGITGETTFLLLDMREECEYDDFHIKESLNFPAPNVTRDKIIPELFRFRNKEDKLIIIYMLDERSGCAAAKLLYEKGYDNVFLLSGGVEEFIQKHANLVEGKNVPDVQQ